MANYATSALKLSDTYVNTLPYSTCSTAAGTAAKIVSAGSFALETGAMVVVKFNNSNTAANPTLSVSNTEAKPIWYNGSAIKKDQLKANTVYQFVYDGSHATKHWDLIGPPSADGTVEGLTVVYPAASCTTFSSDSGTVTPLAVQKGAKMFAITKPPRKGPGEGDTSVTVNAIPRWEDTTGNLKNSKIIIEDVTNSRDSSKKANVLAIPAEGGKKMVYGYCTDQIDGTSFIGGVFDADATSYPYSGGLAIGGTSGNLLWKGKQVATTDMLGSYTNQNAFSYVKVGDIIVAADTKTDTLTLEAGSNVTITPNATDDKITIAATDTNTEYLLSTGNANGTVKFGPVGGTQTDVFVRGLGSAAYTNSDAYAASSHSHTFDNVSGTLPISKGGTGATTVDGALEALGFDEVWTLDCGNASTVI